jgi:putative methyltransferase (TIGR04325 family)
MGHEGFSDMSTESLVTRSLFPSLAEIPGIETLRRRRYERYFAAAQNVHIFRGVFNSFEAAAASAPTSKPLAYDNDAAATMYAHRLRAIASDYPAFFWLQASFSEGMRKVFDVGGSLGIKFFAFRRLVDLPPGVSWTVEDMPAVVDQGKRFASSQEDVQMLSFTDRFSAGDGCDVLFASGSLQYLPETLADMLGTLKHPPLRLIVNATPIHVDRSFFTLNNIGTAFCPYRVSSRPDFLASLTRAGYRLRDHWENPGKSMRIPFHLEHHVEAYSGFCFDRITRVMPS